jgi:predicted Zn-ribbon and HTH transcriptional regulator
LIFNIGFSELNFFNILNRFKILNYLLILITELRVCKDCGNVFSKKAGVSNITSCPQCKGTSFDNVAVENEQLEQE